jgi:hypothetical protein
MIDPSRSSAMRWTQVLESEIVLRFGGMLAAFDLASFPMQPLSPDSELAAALLVVVFDASMRGRLRHGK